MKNDFPFDLFDAIRATDPPPGMLDRIHLRIRETEQLRLSVSSIRWVAAVILLLLAINFMVLKSYRHDHESYAVNPMISNFVTDNSLYNE